MKKCAYIKNQVNSVISQCKKRAVWPKSWTGPRNHVQWNYVHLATPPLPMMVGALNTPNELEAPIISDL